ncbi:MAG: hypothetical protein ACLSXJ_16660 [Clostridium saudiense]|uniref:hypothetical protein n=1 Tax=Clostridium saudiense TaxID=1414720 RepID=UPI003992310A
MNLQECTTKIDLFFDEIKSFEYKSEFDYVCVERNEFRKLLKDLSSLSEYYNIKGALVSRDMLLLWYIPYNYIINDFFKSKESKELFKDVNEVIYGTFNAMINNPTYFDQDKLSLNRISNKKTDIFLNQKITEKYIFLTSILMITLFMGINIFCADDDSLKFINDYIYDKIQTDINFDNCVKILCKI